jgi:hypothetical protein
LIDEKSFVNTLINKVESYSFLLFFVLDSPAIAYSWHKSRQLQQNKLYQQKAGPQIIHHPTISPAHDSHSPPNYLPTTHYEPNNSNIAPDPNTIAPREQWPRLWR